MKEFVLVYVVSSVLVISLNVLCYLIITKKKNTRLGRFVNKHIMTDEGENYQ